MPVNIGKLELEIAKKIGCSTTTDPADLQVLANSVKQLKNNPIDYVSTYSNLPAASATNKGKMYFVDSECTVYWSTGRNNYPLQCSTGFRTLWTWGQNNCGQLGIGNLTSWNSPVTTAGGGTTWCQVAIGCQHQAAVKTDGTLWSWGAGGSGRLGTGNTTSYSSPVTTAGGGTTWRAVASNGGYATLATKTDGTLWGWGFQNTGLLGTGDTSQYSSPVTTAGGGTTWSQVALSSGHAIATKTDGTLWAWGNGGYGKLGTGSTTNYSSPVTTAGGGTTWRYVYVGSSHSLAIKTDGTLWTWGNNSLGPLGTGTAGGACYSSPVTTIAGGTTWCQASGGDSTSAGIKTDGTLWVWGGGGYGRLGTGATTNYSSPVTTAGGGTNWCQISLGRCYSAGVKTDGTLWVWGSNVCGELATGNATSYSSPVTTIAGGTTWCRVTAGVYTSAAITYNTY